MAPAWRARSRSRWRRPRLPRRSTPSSLASGTSRAARPMLLGAGRAVQDGLLCSALRRRGSGRQLPARRYVRASDDHRHVGWATRLSTGWLGRRSAQTQQRGLAVSSWWNGRGGIGRVIGVDLFHRACSPVGGRTQRAVFSTHPVPAPPFLYARESTPPLHHVERGPGVSPEPYGDHHPPPGMLSTRPSIMEPTHATSPDETERVQV